MIGKSKTLYRGLTRMSADKAIDTFTAKDAKGAKVENLTADKR
jgi:hypothetical protein